MRGMALRDGALIPLLKRVLEQEPRNLRAVGPQLANGGALGSVSGCALNDDPAQRDLAVDLLPEVGHPKHQAAVVVLRIKVPGVDAMLVIYGWHLVRDEHGTFPARFPTE